MSLFNFKFGNKRRYEQIEQQNITLEQALQIAQQQNERLKAEHEQLESTLQQQIDRLTEKYEEVVDTSRINDLRTSNWQLMNERVLWNGKEQRLNKENNAIKTINTQLRLELRQLTEQNEQLLAEQLRLNQNCEMLTKERSKLAEQIKKHQQKCEQLEEYNEQYADGYEQILEEYEQQQNISKQLQVQVANLENTNKKLAVNYDGATSKIHDLQMEKATLQDELSQVINSFQNFKAAQQMNEEKRIKVEGQLQQYQKENEQLISQLNTEKDHNRELGRDVAVLQTRLASMQHQLTISESNNERLAAEISAKSHAVFSQEQLLTQVEHLKEQLQQKESQMAELVEQLKTKTTEQILQKEQLELDQKESNEFKQATPFIIEETVQREAAIQVPHLVEETMAESENKPLNTTPLTVFEETESISVLELEDLIQVEVDDLEVELYAVDEKDMDGTFVEIEEEDEPELTERAVEGEQIKEDLAKIVAQSFVAEEPEKPKVKKKVKQRSFAPRTEEYEHRAISQTVDAANEEYKSLMPTGNRFAIRDRDEMRVDYATAYVNEILDSRKEGRRELLRRFMDEPYFARMDIITGQGSASTYYITKNEAGYGGAISWKAEAASLFYLKVVGTPVQHKTLGMTTVDHIQQFSVQRGRIVQFYAPLTNTQGSNFVDDQLIDVLSKRKGENMDAIVSTIQKEQYEMISLPIDKPIIIQGSAGSGKSAIALHRLSYLLYRYPNLTEESVAIIGPNETFLSYIQLVLPALGDYKVNQLTFAHLAKAVAPNKLKFEKETNIQHMERKTSMQFSQLIETYTRKQMNRVDRWFEPLFLQGQQVHILPVVLKMDKYKHILNSDRHNLYYNMYADQWKLQVMKQNERIQQQQQMIAEAVGVYAQSIALPTVEESHFINDVITKDLQQLLQFVALNTAARTLTIEDLAKKIAEKAAYFIKSTIQQLAFQDKFETLLLNLLTIQWKEFVAQQLAIYKDQFIQTHLQADPFITELEPYVKQLEPKWQAERHSILKTIEATKEQCLNEWCATLEPIIQQQAIVAAERHLIQHIQNGFTKILTKYNAQTKFRLAISSISKAEKLLEMKVQPQDDGDIKQYIKKRIELNCWTMYQSLFEEFEEIAAYVPKPKKTIAKTSDMAAMLHIHRLLHGILPEHRFKYMIIDEAQDYLPYEMQEMRMRTSKNGIMLIGDLGQNLNPIATVTTWDIYDDLLNEPQKFELAATYRSTKQIVEFSNQLIGPYAKGRYQLSTVAYRDGQAVEFVKHAGTDEENVVVKAIEQLLYERKMEQVVCIAKNDKDLKRYEEMLDPYFTCGIQTDTKKAENVRVILTTVVDAKGLEFEAVVLLNFNQYEKNDLDRKLAYVAASRALHYLLVIHKKGVCPLLT